MKRLSWKYIAGLIDGEGCIDFQCHVNQQNGEPRLYIVPRLRIGMSLPAKDVLEQLKLDLGGNVWIKKHTQENTNWAPHYYWQIQGKSLRPILQNIVNHLIIKREQARLCIWWIDRCMGRQFNKLDQVIPIRQCARDELKAMKLDPHRLNGEAIKKIMQLIDGCDSRTDISQ